MLINARQSPLSPHMADTPSITGGVGVVIGMMKNGKAGSSSGILFERVEAESCVDRFMDMLLDVV